MPLQGCEGGGLERVGEVVVKGGRRVGGGGQDRGGGNLQWRTINIVGLGLFEAGCGHGAASEEGGALVGRGDVEHGLFEGGGGQPVVGWRGRVLVGGGRNIVRGWAERLRGVPGSKEGGPQSILRWALILLLEVPGIKLHLGVGGGGLGCDEVDRGVEPRFRSL